MSTIKVGLDSPCEPKAGWLKELGFKRGAVVIANPAEGKYTQLSQWVRERQGERIVVEVYDLSWKENDGISFSVMSNGRKTDFPPNTALYEREVFVALLNGLVAHKKEVK